MAVSEMAISIGKKMAKTGVKIVPNPNPEKKVRREARNATAQITIIGSIFFEF